MKRRSSTLSLLAALLMLVSGVSFAADKSATTVSGVIFANYQYYFSEYLSNGVKASDSNSFDISRVYLKASQTFNDKMSAYVQLEANLISRDATVNQVILKNAVLEIKDIYTNGNLSLGLVPTIWVDFETSFWGMRFMSKTVSDVDIALPSADRGVVVKGTLPNIVYEAMVINGEGHKANEINKYKDAAVRVAVAPFKDKELKNLKVNAYLQQGYSTADSVRNALFGGLSYESSKWKAMGNYYTTERGDPKIKGAGYMLLGHYYLNAKDWVFARLDNWDADTNVSDNAYSRITAGVGRKLADNLRLAVSIQSLTQEKETIAAKNQNVFTTDLEIKF